MAHVNFRPNAHDFRRRHDPRLPRLLRHLLFLLSLHIDMFVSQLNAAMLDNQPLVSVPCLSFSAPRPAVPSFHRLQYPQATLVAVFQKPGIFCTSTSPRSLPDCITSNSINTFDGCRSYCPSSPGLPFVPHAATSFSFNRFSGNATANAAANACCAAAPPTASSLAERCRSLGHHVALPKPLPPSIHFQYSTPVHPSPSATQPTSTPTSQNQKCLPPH